MDIEEKDYEPYVRRIEQIDKILREPIATLVDVVLTARERAEGRRQPLEIPPRIMTEREDNSPLQLYTALCCSTLQRLWQHRRRFPHLEKEFERLEEGLKGDRPLDHVLESLAEPFLPANPRKASYLAGMSNPNCGPLDPTTAAQVFWVLLNSGEKNAHTGTGFCAFFVMLWALHRELPEPGGVAAGDSPPSAYLTAKCLAPLFNLLELFRRRAGVLDDIAGLLERLRELRNSRQPRQIRWWLPLRLDELTSKLYELSTIAISREGFSTCAKSIDAVADSLHNQSDMATAWPKVEAALLCALQVLGRTSSAGLSEANKFVGTVLRELVRSLKQKKLPPQLAKLGLKAPDFRAASKTEDYRQDLVTAAMAAHTICRAALRELSGVSRRCRALTRENGRSIPRVFRELAEANRRIVSILEPATVPAVGWCEQVLTRQVAHASARNLTEFDPAELLSALFATTRGRRGGSSLRVTDAVVKALVGVRADGSWVPGQPFLVITDLGVWAPTSDIVWMLSSIIARHPDVCAADAALQAYVDWLERTKRTLSFASGKVGARSMRTASGWISERNLLPDGVDVWATSYAINALLGIREVMEFRLWELCERRFTILEPTRRLSEIDAVDLGAAHKHRLHRRLAQMARQAAGEDYKHAEYSLILHGPPGSSKTAITEALATEMWRSLPLGGRRAGRLIRITPADFTRKGEGRLDSEARIIFHVLGHLRGVTVLFDEIDDLVRLRDDQSEVSFFKLVVPAMLNRLQDLRDACPKQEI
jgi:hypothetical protein